MNTINIAKANRVHIGVMTGAILGVWSFIAGLLACNWMITLVKSSKLYYFSIYCFLVGTIAIAYSYFYM
jgi:undecaprenyl-diphosphatase